MIAGFKPSPFATVSSEMSHYTGTEQTLTTKAQSEESEKPVKFEGETKLLSKIVKGVSASLFKFAAIGEEVRGEGAGILAAGTKILSLNSAKSEIEISILPEKEGKEKLELVNPVTKPYKWVGWPQQVDFAEYISGTVTTSKKSIIEIQQSFNLPSPSIGSGDSVEKWAEEGTWVPASWAEYIEAAKMPTQWTINGESISISAFAGAPYWRVVVTSESEGNKIKVFAHAFERGRV